MPIAHSGCGCWVTQVFLIHIMDYAFGVDDGTSKLHHRMRFGPELKILPSWMSDCCPNKRDARYRLVSTVTHHGRHAAGEAGL